MSSNVNRYKADLREMQFVLFEQFKFDEVAGAEPFAAWGIDEAKAVIQETYRFSREVLGPINASGDREGCRLVDGQVVTPKGFKEAWKKLYEAGFKSLAASPEHGGQGAPSMLHVLIEEMLSGANAAFNMYPGLAYGAAEVIATCGTAAQGKLYVPRMMDGTWGGTMCLTEPQAGSDVGAAKATAKRLPDGTYRIKGTKIFISGGDHDLAQNIIHLVLARVDGAPAGTKGLSLFIVPKLRLPADGQEGKPNDVVCTALEHKLGINGSATAVLNFGDNDDCVGELVGTVEHQGMAQMFKMMNGARIAVGVQGVSLAASAYLNALEYAKDRKQGSHFTRWKDPTQPRVPIFEHPDVRRMLLELKSHTEGIRMLLMKLAAHNDRAAKFQGKDDEKAAYHRGQVELLTPLVKAFASDEGFRLSAVALQVYGGAGYLKDWPVEQYLRDAKIGSIYEGTNHIQAMDLVGRKMGQAGGAHFQQFMGDVSAFAEQHRAHPVYGEVIKHLASAQDGVLQNAMAMLGWSGSDKVALVPLAANRFLEMMSRLTVGWLLLEAGVRADAALAKLDKSHPDCAFYEGKRASALWFGRNVLPLVEAASKINLLEDDSPMTIPDAGFALD